MMSRVEISKRLVLINTASGILTRVVNVSVVVGLNALLLRRVDPEELQFLPLLLSIIALLPLFTVFLTSGLGRFMLTAYAQGDDRGVTRIASTMFPLVLAAGGIIFLAGLILAWRIDWVLVVPPERLREARIMMVLLAFSTAAKLSCVVFSMGFYLRQRFLLGNLINLGGEFLRMALLAGLLLGVGTSVLSVVTANVATEFTTTLVVMIVSLRMIPALRFRAREIQWSCAREIMSFGGWSFLGQLSNKVRESLILGILNWQATPLDVTLFNVGYQARRQIDAWTDLMAVPLYPVVTSMYAIGAKDRIRSIYLRGGRIALWIMLVVGIPACIYAQTVVRLYATATYLEAAAVMVMTLAGLPLGGGAWMIWQVSSATGRIRALSLFMVLMQVAVVGMSSVSVYVLGWGATGVALACLVVGLLSEVLLLWPLGLKLSGATFDAWSRETLIPGLMPGCVAGVVWAALNVLVPPQGWLGLGACTAAGVLCYGAVLLAFCLEPRDREDLARVIEKIKNVARRRLAVSEPVPSPAGAYPERMSPSATVEGPRD